MRICARHLLALIVLGLVLTRPTAAAEYADEDILPLVTTLTFLSDRVILGTESGFFRFFDHPNFVYSREAGIFEALTDEEYERLLDGSAPRRLAESPHITTDGSRYAPRHCVWDEWKGERHISELAIAGRTFEIPWDGCVSISEIETIGDTVWLGTYVAGGHGDYGAEGLVVADSATGEIVSRIDTGRLAIRGVRLDPVTGFIWAVTDEQVTVVNQGLEIVARYMFYHGFDGETGAPSVSVSDSGSETHPLAVVASLLPTRAHRSFYRAVMTIPDPLARDFDLYDFFMCCSFPAERRWFLPAEFGVLAPFLRIAAEHNGLRVPEPSRRNSLWRQLACRLDDPQAQYLCDLEDWGISDDSP